MLATGGISGGASSSLPTDALPRRATLRVVERRNKACRVKSSFSSLDRALLHKHRADFSSNENRTEV